MRVATEGVRFGGGDGAYGKQKKQKGGEVSTHDLLGTCCGRRACDWKDCLMSATDTLESTSQHTSIVVAPAPGILLIFIHIEVAEVQEDREG